MIAAPLLGAHVRGRAERDSHPGERSTAGRAAQRARDTEVSHERVTVMQEDILRLDVTMHDATAMGVVERFGGLAGEPDRIRDRQATIAREPCTERLAIHERHRVIRQPVGLAGAEQRHDVRVEQRCGELNLAAKAFDATRRSHLRREHLDDDAPAE